MQKGEKLTYLGRRASTELNTQTDQNSTVAMVTNGTKYISQKMFSMAPYKTNHKKDKIILPHKIK